MTIRSMPEPPYSVQQAAHVLGISADTVRAMIHRGELPGAFRAGQKLWKIPVASVDTYRKKHTIE
jgi:excisionase family DNA binding protein